MKKSEPLIIKVFGQGFYAVLSFTGQQYFVAIAREGLIHIYDRNDGHKWGELRPDESVHKQSGWADFNYCINAFRQADGSYLIMNEENAFAKVMVYRMRE